MFHCSSAAVIPGNDSGAVGNIKAKEEFATNAESSTNAPANAGAVIDLNSDELPTVELISDAELRSSPVPSTGTETVASTTPPTPQVPKVTQATLPPSGLDIPELLQPTGGVKVEAGSLVDFKWRSVPNAVSYDFFIYDSVGKKMVESLTGIAAKTLCRDGDECRLTREVALPVASHAWRVRANFQNGQSPFSSSRFAVVR